MGPRQTRSSHSVDLEFILNTEGAISLTSPRQSPAVPNRTEQSRVFQESKPPMDAPRPAPASPNQVYPGKYFPREKAAFTRARSLPLRNNKNKPEPRHICSVFIPRGKNRNFHCASEFQLFTSPCRALWIPQTKETSLAGSLEETVRGGVGRCRDRPRVPGQCRGAFPPGLRSSLPGGTQRTAHRQAPRFPGQ